MEYILLNRGYFSINTFQYCNLLFKVIILQFKCWGLDNLINYIDKIINHEFT